MRDDDRTIEVHADRAQWEKLRENDRVKVTYRMGKYTGTSGTPRSTDPRCSDGNLELARHDGPQASGSSRDARVTALLQQSHTRFTCFKQTRHNWPVGVRGAVNAAEIKTEKPNTN